MSFEIKPEVREDYIVVFLVGKFEFSVKEDFFNRMKKYEDLQQCLLIDLQNITFIDSAGLGILASFAKRCRGINKLREVKIINPRGQVRASLQLTSFSRLIPVLDSDQEYSTFTPI